jgi:RNA polymerase sigma-70 factor (ECF subfamily)
VVTLSDRQISTEIIESCRSGDRNAFRALYATQQVFLKLMTNIAQFRGDAEFSTWLYRLVVNVCMDAARRRQSDRVIANGSSLEAIAAPCSPEDVYARAQAAGAVRAAVSALPPKLRMAVLLRYFDDLSYEQIATVLQCSMGTVASRLSRGHKMLADRLKAVDAHPPGAGRETWRFQAW